MDRLASNWKRSSCTLLLLAIVAAAGGCSVLPFVAYLVKGISTPAEFSGLKGKKVAVICRPVASLQYQSSSVATELADRVGALLREHVSKIQIIEQSEVEKWEDENNWEEYVEIGKALQAEMVVGIDLDQFSLLQGQTLYQGKASIDLSVYDMSRENGPSFKRCCPSSSIPPMPPFRRPRSRWSNSASSFYKSWRSRWAGTSTTTIRRPTLPSTAWPTIAPPGPPGRRLSGSVPDAPGPPMAAPSHAGKGNSPRGLIIRPRAWFCRHTGAATQARVSRWPILDAVWRQGNNRKRRAAAFRERRRGGAARGESAARPARSWARFSIGWCSLGSPWRDWRHWSLSHLSSSEKCARGDGQDHQCERASLEFSGNAFPGWAQRRGIPNNKGYAG